MRLSVFILLFIIFGAILLVFLVHPQVIFNNLGYVYVLKAQLNAPNETTLSWLDGAERLFNILVRRDLADASTWIGLSRLALLRGDDDQSAEYLHNALTIDADDPIANALMGDLAVHDDSNLAFEYYMRSKFYKKAVRLAQESANQLRWDEAYKRFKHLYDAGVDLPQVTTGVGQALLYQTGDLNQAMPWFEMAFRDQPKYVWSYIYLGDYYLTQNQSQQAFAWYLAANKANPEHEWPYIYLGSLYVSKKNTLQACYCYQKAIDINSTNPSAYGGLARCLALSGELSRAFDAAQRAVELAPDKAWTHLLLGQLLRQQGRYDLAKAEIEQALDINPGDMMILNELEIIVNQLENR